MDEATRMLVRIKDQINFEWTDAQRKMDALNMAIEALERKHGEWIYDGLTFENDSLYKCSICCHRVPMEYGEMKFYSYCPNCGADMRGDND